MADKLNAKNTAKKKYIAKAVVDYLIYVESNFRRALDIASEATVYANYEDWWWKSRIGKCYFKLGMIKEAERQLISSLKSQDMVCTHLELAKVSIRKDQPAQAIDVYEKGTKVHKYEVHLFQGISRVHEMLNDSIKSNALCKKILIFDNTNMESIATLASYHFYTDQPEVALRFYRRLIQCGVNNSELWNNLGLCCFYASQYDMALSCFERALSMSDDTNVSDIWYNIGHIAIGIGDLGLAYQAFKIAVSSNPDHAESFNNLGVLELRKGNVEQAKSNFQSSHTLAEFFEPCYNLSLLLWKKGDFQESFKMIQIALQIFPDHVDSKELKKNLLSHFSSL